MSNTMKCGDIEIGWIRIVTNIFESQKIKLIDTLPDRDAIIVIWFKLLTLAGTMNNSGVFILGKIHYTDEMLAALFNRPVNTVRMALKTFEEFGMIEVEHETYMIPNWEKYQYEDGMARIRESNRLRQQKCREKQKALLNGEVLALEDNVSRDSACDVTPQEEKRKKKKERNKCSDEFEAFWSVYPRRKEKLAASKAFSARIKEKEVTAEELIVCAKRYADECKHKRTKEQYIKHAATFLGPDKPYEDYLPSSEQLQGQMNIADIPGVVPEPEVLTDEQLAELGYE